MKKARTLMVFALGAAVLAVSQCASSSSEAAAAAATSVCASATLTGNITANRSVGGAAQTITLCGPTVVKSPAILTIAAGTTIKATKDADSVLIIERGARIVADGDAANPIIFTSNQTTPAAGDWGGLVINGNSTYASATGLGTGEGNSGTYGGGTTPTETDNSGTLDYVRVEYGGEQFSTENELNGIAFQGVGNGTTVSNLQIWQAKDDGLEFFGGTVNATNVIIIGAQDDQLDWTSGWIGTIKGLIVVHYGGDSDSNAIEADHDSTAPTNTGYIAESTRSLPVIVNATFVGNNTRYKNIFLFRRGTGAIMRNIYVANFCGINDVNGTDSAAGGWLGTSLVITNSVFEAIRPLGTTAVGATCTDAALTSSTGSVNNTALYGANVVFNAANSTGFTHTTTNFQPGAAIAGTASTASTTGGTYAGFAGNSVTPDNWIGAIQNGGTNWPATSGWARFN